MDYGNDVEIASQHKLQDMPCVCLLCYRPNRSVRVPVRTGYSSLSSIWYINSQP